jgi:hypothetical protein
MGAYLASRIIAGAYNYAYVISKRPDLKADIDSYLVQEGRQDLITQ